MWFKNLMLYRLPAPWSISLEKLEQQLSRGVFSKCPSNQPSSRGWAAPRNSGELVTSVGGQWLICLCEEHRILPGSVVNDEVKERAEALEAQQGYYPGRKQMKELRERVTEELLPRAFTRRNKTFIWIDPKNGWFAARPSGTEDVYKIYAESFKGEAHLKQIQEEAQAIVADAFRVAGV